MLLALYVENVDGIRIWFKATVLYARYRTILYYITIQYFIFLFFLVLYHTHTQHVGGNKKFVKNNFVTPKIIIIIIFDTYMYQYTSWRKSSVFKSHGQSQKAGNLLACYLQFFNTAIGRVRVIAFAKAKTLFRVDCDILNCFMMALSGTLALKTLIAALLAPESTCCWQHAWRKNTGTNDENYFLYILIFDNEMPSKCGIIPSNWRKEQGQCREKKIRGKQWTAVLAIFCWGLSLYDVGCRVRTCPLAQ
jgi:hypothetical protein